jgi:hypothetical protein
MKKTIFFIAALWVVSILSSCTKDSDGSSNEPGTGGSMARFTIKNDYLYAVDHSNLHTFRIDGKLVRMQEQYLGFAIETIFPSGDHLFIGAQNGMHIYDIKIPALPKKVSFTPHFVSYDPVIVQGNYAYVTLRAGDGFPGGTRNLLQIYDISKLNAPQQVAEYAMSSPRGLGIDGDKLFICDNMLKVFRVENGYELTLLKTFDINGIDVIPRNNRLYVVASDGFYQYHYDDENITLISKITLPQKETK